MARQTKHPPDDDKSRATEQQLKAANQQLRASEQQLKAANQQLQAEVTEHKKAEEELRESEERYREQFEHALDAIFVADAETGILVNCNRAALKLVGRAKSELIGQHQRILHPPEETGVEEGFSKSFKKHLKEKEGQILEAKIITKEGQIKDVIIMANLAEIGGKKLLRGTFRDITESNRAEKALREERDRAQKHLNIAEVIFIAVNARGEVTLVNKKGCEVLGYDEAEIIGKNWFHNFLPKRLRKEVKAVFKELMAAKVEPVEYFENPVRIKNGGERIIAWHNTTLRDESGNITGTLSSGEDITERKKAEEALKATNQQLRASEQQLRAANEQLQASEQQLRATNQQLRASEQQLKAANQQLQASQQQASCLSGAAKIPRFTTDADRGAPKAPNRHGAARHNWPVSGQF